MKKLTKRMDDKDKEKFILEWIKKNDGHIDTLNAYFVDDYIGTVKPKKIHYKNWGADNVPELTRLLKKMYDEGKLKRFVVNINPRPVGFPKWVYSYHLNNL
jgi:hypothetical protein